MYAVYINANGNLHGLVPDAPVNLPPAFGFVDVGETYKDRARWDNATLQFIPKPYTPEELEERLLAASTNYQAWKNIADSMPGMALPPAISAEVKAREANEKAKLKQAIIDWG